MRTCVVIDANVFLSFLLNPDKQTATVHVVRSAIAGDLALVFPPGIAEELRRKVREKPYFRSRITEGMLESLLKLIQEVGMPPWEQASWPVRSSDPDDQYLLDAAAGNGVDFLITGDRGLLATDRAADSALIVTPAQFLSLVELNTPE
ncbi:MAG: putative toxin-antitoxin system toxin component, PIN family [Thermomicrobiales bacterium]|nr:putative toxin-antitoxin system toxin component, PIN family [Thermomicrobiales bacterium]MCO5220717.1 putative toxin-antitoxin system toxin component, PIN family [Thermomicrobiales bacterium]